MKNLNAPIVAVTVYVDRARVTRRGIVHLSPGEDVVAVGPIPTTLDEDSIRTSGKGLNVRILGAEVGTRYVTETPDVDAAELQRQLQALYETKKTLADDDAAENNRLELLKSLRDSSGARFAKAIATGKAGVDNFKPLAAYLDEELRALQARRREIAQKLRDLEKEIQVTEARLQHGPSSTAQEWREVRVAVEATTEANLELEITYVVANATWESIYDIRLVDTSVTVTYLAQVRQQTGEDWPEVELELSTARPATSATVPKLSPWYVNQLPASPPRMPMAVSQAAGAAQPARRAMMEEPGKGYYEAAPAPEAEVVEATVEMDGASVTYRVARPVAIASDAAPHKTTVATLELEAKLDYVTVPKLVPEIYLRARIRNSSTYLLLPGHATVFHGNEMVGTTILEHSLAPNEEFDTQLGLVDSVKVERELTERSTSKVLIGNNRRITFGYKLIVTNNMLIPAHVIAYDQLPVARHEDIKVRLVNAQPQPAEQNELNILKWDFIVVPQRRMELTFSFAIEYPRQMTITGLGYDTE